MNIGKLKATIFAFVVMLIHPSFASAEADSYVGGGYINIDGDISGWGVGWSMVDEKYAVGVSFSRLEGEVNVTGGGFEYGFTNLKEGSFYIGFDYANASATGFESESDTSVSVGYSKTNPAENSWDVWISDGDGDPVFGGDLRVPMSEQLGMTFGFATTDGINMYDIGISYSF